MADLPSSPSWRSLPARAPEPFASIDMSRFSARIIGSKDASVQAFSPQIRTASRPSKNVLRNVQLIKSGGSKSRILLSYAELSKHEQKRTTQKAGAPNQQSHQLSQHPCPKARSAAQAQLKAQRADESRTSADSPAGAQGPGAAAAARRRTPRKRTPEHGSAAPRAGSPARLGFDCRPQAACQGASEGIRPFQQVAHRRRDHTRGCLCRHRRRGSRQPVR